MVRADSLHGQLPQESAGQPVQREFQADAFTHDDHALRLLVIADRSSLTLAQRLRVRLEARMPLDWHVTWPAFGMELGEFNVISVSEPVPGVIQGGDDATGAKVAGISMARTVVLEPNYALKHEIPAMEFTFVPPSGVIGKTIKLTTDPVAIQLTSLLDEAAAPPDASKIRGIAPIEPGFVAKVQKFAQEHQTSLIVAGGVLVAGLAGITFMAMRRQRTLAMSPETIARRRLSRIVVPADAAPHVVAGAMVELADIARQYAAAQFQLPKADRTSEELITDLAGIQGVPLAELKQMLMQFDQVKFAGATAHPGDV
ncbi:MAG: hypothetical protein H7210_08410, partial [Pyrinomonadaceae bacterium]|nr:hypothetical protein [Phycisphaerales bacterium]